uniref:RE21313p n=1 Tax=Drosophila melanogaster TaxID=7227 RepID=Q8SXU1_DROME|nr:RE21313p [Drosophila melanogaster]
MTTPLQTRMALAEIPDRLEALRMANTPTNSNRRTPDEPTPAAIINTPNANGGLGLRVDNDVNVVQAQDFVFSPLPSPDELVIRQRGRRRFTTTYSQDKVNGGGGAGGGASGGSSMRSPFQRTPTKNFQLTSGMILRSSPRKRLTMGSTPPEPTPMDTYSPIKMATTKQLWPGTPVVKKLKMEDRPVGQTNTDATLPSLLQGLSQEQLIDLIMNNIKSASDEGEIRTQLPTPDISALEQDLHHAKRLIFKSLPTSRLCKKTDAAAYSKASMHLNEFKRVLQSQAKRLHDSTHWDALVDYVSMAWQCVASTPNWESHAHNAVRRQCFKLLACSCYAAIKHGGMRLGQLRLETLERNLREWSKDYEDVLSCVNALQRTLNSRSSL